MKGLFLLGTDTGVGKTSLACGLLHLARQRGCPLVPYKPVETGCDPFPQDALRLLHASGHPHLTTADICPYPLRTPVAPTVAARLEGRSLDRRLLVARAASLAGPDQSLLAEGAGGILTPYAPSLDGATLAALLDLDVLLVAANRLGTINHTLLAMEALRNRRLRCVGIVLVDVGPSPGPDAATNAAEIATAGGTKPLGTLRFVRDLSPAALALAVAADIDLSPLLSGALHSQL
jgi:dethiobiotin synthetase